MRASDITGRREFLALLAAAASTGLPGAASAQGQGSRAGSRRSASASTGKGGTGLTYLTPHEFATLEEVAEMIIPADQRSGGARAAGVAALIDARLAESLDPSWRKSWKDDLAEIDRLSNRDFGRNFIAATFTQRARLLDRISRRESDPKEPGEYAFGTIKWAVSEAYYRTRIGIHDEIGYKGNVIQDEFTGIDVSRG